MRTLTSILTLAILFTAAGDVWGQTAPDLEHELRNMAAAETSVDRDRQDVLDFLDRSDVRVAAATHGIDVEALPGAVGSMDAVAMADLARHVRDLADERD